MHARAPFPWFGGKQHLAPALCDLLPAHDVYVECFGGAASLLFSKPPSRLEVYNDVDSGLVNFFRILRDPKRAKELRRVLNLTPYSREEWQECRATWQDAPTDIEMARRWFTVVVQAFAGRYDSGPGWRFTKDADANPARKFRTAVANLPAFMARVAEVQIDHKDFAGVIESYDTPSTLFYCDPPYLPETRREHGYRHEMTADDHRRLLAAVTACEGMVLLSGYRSPLYDAELAGWRRVDYATVNRAANTERAPRVECVWIKPNAERRGLWNIA